MDPRQKEKRARLRSTYSEAVLNLLQALKSEPKVAYSNDDLAGLRVSFVSFDPENQSFLESQACAFRPMDSSDLKQFYLRETELPEGNKHLYCNFDQIYDELESMNYSPACVTGHRAHQIFSYLCVSYSFLEKESGKDLEFFQEFDGWHHFK